MGPLSIVMISFISVGQQHQGIIGRNFNNSSTAMIGFVYSYEHSHMQFM